MTLEEYVREKKPEVYAEAYAESYVEGFIKGCILASQSVGYSKEETIHKMKELRDLEKELCGLDDETVRQAVELYWKT